MIVQNFVVYFSKQKNKPHEQEQHNHMQCGNEEIFMVVEQTTVWEHKLNNQKIAASFSKGPSRLHTTINDQAHIYLANA